MSDFSVQTVESIRAMRREAVEKFDGLPLRLIIQLLDEAEMAARGPEIVSEDGPASPVSAIILLEVTKALALGMTIGVAHGEGVNPDECIKSLTARANELAGFTAVRGLPRVH